MDSHDDLHDAIPSNLSTFKVKTLKMIAAASLKTRFYENYCSRQPFSLPDSIMHYIAKHSSTSKVYQKMVKSCKYFFVKNQIIVIRNLKYDHDKKKWTTFAGRKCFDLDNIGCKFWITERVSIFNESSATDMQNLVSPIVTKIYRCDAEYLYIFNQTISYENYCVLSTCAKEIEFCNVTVKNEDGSITPLEKLIEAAPKLKDARFSSDIILFNITSNTVQELVKLPNFSKIEILRLESIPETFNLDAFFIYMKANNFTNFCLDFANTISDGYKNRLEEINDEILGAKEIDFKPPFIDFDGNDHRKYNELVRIYRNVHLHL